MNLKLPPLSIIILLSVTFLTAVFVLVRSIIVEYYGWGFILALIYFGIGAGGFFFLLLSVNNNLRYQRLAGLSLDDEGNLEFKRMKQFAQFLQITDDQLALDFGMINTRLQKKATAKELMNGIAKLMIRENIPYEQIIKDFKAKKRNSIKDLSFQLTMTGVMKD